MRDIRIKYKCYATSDSRLSIETDVDSIHIVMYSSEKESYITLSLGDAKKMSEDLLMLIKEVEGE